MGYQKKEVFVVISNLNPLPDSLSFVDFVGWCDGSTIQRISVDLIPIQYPELKSYQRRS